MYVFKSDWREYLYLSAKKKCLLTIYEYLPSGKEYVRVNKAMGFKLMRPEQVFRLSTEGNTKKRRQRTARG